MKDNGIKAVAVVLSMLLIGLVLYAVNCRECGMVQAAEKADFDVVAKYYKIVDGILMERSRDEQEAGKERTDVLAVEERGQEVFPDVGTEIPLEEKETMETKAESTVSVAPTAYSVSGVTLDPDIAEHLRSELESAGIGRWLPYALAQMFQESAFDPLAENPNGRDKGIIQYRIDYWDNSRGDIFDWKAQISLYVEQTARRLNSGLGIEETISRHKQSDYGPYDPVYVNQVMQWVDKEEIK